uniref:Ribosomal RNA-processing protein 17 n=1 Tax=Dunaliella tertiolecta TaxID=3047 RepID=A0A7S3VUG8_DUNTE|mmetsp:Transcript_27288/g.73754  ORF Transcript_27288/g.73754 Transcript_27288/m.73754 type:complete len:232 (+) Transcript_27288:54-749(+)
MPKRKPRDDHDALVFHRKQEDEELHANHVRKKDKRTKGIEVVFDPARHKDFITGFRKRKQQRRKEAQEQIKERERQQRIANRAEKRSKLKEELGLDDNWGDSSSEPDSDVGQQGGSCAGDEGAGGTGKPAEEKDGKVVVYQQQGLMTTVTTMPIEDDPFHQSSSDEERGKKDNKPRQGWQKQQEKGSGKGGKGVQKKQHQKTSNKGKQKGKGKPGKRDKVKSAKGPKRNAR